MFCVRWMRWAIKSNIIFHIDLNFNLISLKWLQASSPVFWLRAWVMYQSIFVIPYKENLLWDIQFSFMSIVWNSCFETKLSWKSARKVKVLRFLEDILDIIQHQLKNCQCRTGHRNMTWNTFRNGCVIYCAEENFSFCPGIFIRWKWENVSSITNNVQPFQL